MGFTIEDMLVLSKEKYQMEQIAGANGWSNSISWILQIEDNIILSNFKGKELAVTTGLGFRTEEKLLALVERLLKQHASGLIINTGYYIKEIPDSLIKLCDENDFPLITVPWSILLLDMIKDLSVRLFFQSAADEQIGTALIHAIEEPDAMDLYKKDLLPYFDIDGTFQVALITTGDLDIMDTVDRRRLGYQMQVYLENITHNASFFYYDSCFALVINAVPKEDVAGILDGFFRRFQRKNPDKTIAVGVSSILTDVTNLHICYKRARSAMDMAFRTHQGLLYFDNMGMYRLLSSVPDQRLLSEMGPELLKPILNYDHKHNTNYVETLESYLKHNGSIQAVAEEMFTHRNTIIYRVNNIKKLLDCTLDTAEERMRYQIACLILHM
jgi:hypothetical protein